MNKILFTHSYFYKLDAKQWKFRQPYPPLGTLVAAAVMRNEGFQVKVHDTGLNEHPSELLPALAQEAPAYLVIYDDGFNYLTKMCLTVMREAAFEMARAAEEKGCIVIISSSDSSDHYEKYFDNGVDYVIRGEGEQTLKELIHALEEKKSLSEITGLAYRQDQQTVRTPARAVMRQLDDLPTAAWDLIDLEAYRQIWLQHHGYFSLNLATTRGCPYKCNWCAKPIYGNRYNVRSPEKVVEEISWLMEQYHPDHFWMSDDIFGLKPGWVKRFSELVAARKLTFTYKIQSRVDLLLQEDNVEALARSGAETIWVGAESGSQKILDAMDKGTTVDQIRQARLLLGQKGIKVAFFLQFGYLGETKEDIDATMQMVLDLMPEEVGISVSYPLPGTVFFEKVKATLEDKQNWKDSDDLAMMFKGTYAPAFYRVLHRYVHGRYRIQRGLNLIVKLFTHPFIPRWSALKTLASAVYHTPITGWYALQLKMFSPNAH